MPYYFFHWTSEAIEHVGEHDVSPAEFEAIVMQPESRGVSRSTGRHIAFGYTPEGRFLACVFEQDKEDVFPITAYDVQE
ncbi:hypothetical protein K2D_11120 [Planctomycetes bacterium K2D]|uniref:DUF4258 domain-containing protein n=1 Tax=Botrimarina mediterranea TaxID=2528022 RepID=A0A518K570_9BACT|nr:hypothetical protein Spa11_11290 [Botrimarina mediterranea]QDV77516.1 hypothetical protein K2D_11120 [Planctomycetes bacterium K2D]